MPRTDRRRFLKTAAVAAAHRSTTLCSIGAIGMLTGRKLVWDPVREEFPGDHDSIGPKGGEPQQIFSSQAISKHVLQHYT